MANVQHSSLEDPNIHEPKGIFGITADRIYISDGADSGNWRPVNRTPGTGWGQYNNSIYTGTTYLSVPDTGVILPFNTNTDETQLPTTLNGATSSLMDLASETLLFVSEGDLHSITLTFLIVSTTASSTYMDLILNTSTDGTTYGTLVSETTVPILKGGTNQRVNVSSLFPISANMATHGARITLKMETGKTANIKDFNLISARVHKART